MTDVCSLSGIFPIEKSEYYAFYLKEKEEILKHKWVLSEKAGCDVGYDYAQWDWIMRGYRASWRNWIKTGIEK